MLALTCHRAQLHNGERILELGCGWGSLTLWMAEHYPDSEITALSNSRPQRAWIEAQAEKRGLHNLQVITADINDFDTAERNDPLLFARLSRWLQPGGTLFVHIFGHVQDSYFFVDEHPRDWMARDLLPGLCAPLQLERDWVLSGRHYQRTSEAWLARMDARKKAVMPILSATYGPEQSLRWWVYWRVFFMAVAELFGHADGEGAKTEPGCGLCRPRTQAARPICGPIFPPAWARPRCGSAAGK